MEREDRIASAGTICVWAAWLVSLGVVVAALGASVWSWIPEALAFGAAGVGAVGVLFLTPLAPAMLALDCVRHRRRYGGPERCARCGYPSEGLPPGRCPECGGLAEPAEPPLDLERIWAPDALTGASGLLMCSLGLLVVVVVGAAYAGVPPTWLTVSAILTAGSFLAWLAARQQGVGGSETPVAVYLLVTLGWGGWFFLAMAMLGRLAAEYEPLTWGCFGPSVYP